MGSSFWRQIAYGAIEAGGTKWNCMIGTGPDEILTEVRFPTTDPEETLGRAIAFFANFQRHNELLGLGIGSFGPIDLAPGSPTYGFITSTPKPGWANTDVVGELQRELNVPIVFDTDVNAAGFGEHLWGAGQGCGSIVYLTVGTGVGGGALVHGRPLHGLVHPEMGHMLLPHDRERDQFDGICPYHGNCLEGLASGPALEARWGRPAHELPEDHPAWALEAHYLAQAAATLICTLSPQRIILGGGVMAQEQLFPLIRAEVRQLLGGYIQSPAILDHIEDYIVPPALGARAGVLGALALGAGGLEGQAQGAKIVDEPTLG